MHVGQLRRRTVLLAAAAVLAAGCSRPRASGPPRLVLAAGPPGAVYREIGGELAAQLREHMPGTEVVVLETRASRDNLRLLETGRAHLGLANIDSVVAADGGPVGGIRALGRLYDSFLHLLVPAGSPVRSLADLEGRRVSLGARGSGTEFTALRLSELTGVVPDGVHLDQAASARALETGEIEVMFSLTGLPTPAVGDLARRHPLRCVDLGGAIDLMADVFPDSYFPATIPATTYTGVPPCRTISVPNLLLSREDLPEDVAYLVTGTTYTRAGLIAVRRPEAAQLNVRTGIATGVVPLHPGAARWFRDQKPE